MTKVIMSLVAYTSSDEGSDASDTEISNEGRKDSKLTPERSTSNVTETSRKQLDDSEHFQISDEEETEYGNSSATLPQSATDSTNRRNLFALLPKPQKESLYVPSEEEDDFVKKVPGKKELPRVTVKSEVEKDPLDQAEEKGENRGERPNGKKDATLRTMPSLPKPKNVGKARKTTLVKIGLPVLNELDSDSDDESAKVVRKPPKPGKSGSGLMSLLPQPHQGVLSRNKGTGPLQQKERRKLIPYVLSESKKTLKNPSTATENIKTIDSDDESDDEASNFFSLGSSKNSDISTSSFSGGFEGKEWSSKGSNLARQPNYLSPEKESKQMDDPIISAMKHSTFPAYKGVNADSDIGVANKDQTMQILNPKLECNASHTLSKSSAKHDKLTLMTTPSQYEQNKCHGTYTAASNDSSSSVTGPYLQQDSEVTGPYGNTVTDSYFGGQFGVNSNDHGNPLFYAYQDNQSAACWGHQGQPAEDLQLDHDTLLKLQGKRKSSKEPLTIVDVRGDQLEGSTNDLLKQLTEENVHQGKRAKAEMPRSLERRKHQITYLAFQAKERELELKNTWAANSQTRRQTQGKYGF